MGGGGSKTHYVYSGISQAQYNAEAARANNAEAAAEALRIEVAAAHRRYNLSLRPTVSALRPEVMNPDFVPQLLRQVDSRRDKSTSLHAVFMSLAGAGKSTFLNNVIRAILAENIPAVRSVGSATVEGGQHSTVCQRVGLGRSFVDDYDADSKGDILFTDTVGLASTLAAETIALGKGLLHESEAFPRDDSEESVLKRAEIHSRQPQAPHVNAFVLFISVYDLINRDPAHIQLIRGIIHNAKTLFKVGPCTVEIPVFICVTKCDDFTTNPHFNNLLEQRRSENLQEIFAKCQQELGIPQDNVFALGWMNQSDEIDWSYESQDPRCLAVRHALYQIVRAATTCHNTLHQYRQRYEPRPAAPPPPPPRRPAPQQQQQQNQQNQQNDHNNNSDDRFQELILQQFSDKIELDLLLSVLNQMKNLPPNQVIERLTEMSSTKTTNTNNNNKKTTTAPPPPRPSQNQNQHYQHQQPGAATAGPSSSSQYRRDYMPPPPPPNNHNNTTSRQDYHYPRYQRPNANDDDTWTFTSTSSVRSSTNSSCSKSSAQSLKEQDITLAALAEDFNRRRRAFNGTMQQFIATLNSRELYKFLLSRRFFAENVLNLILNGKWDGKDFVADDFIPKAFYQDETVMSLYNINPVNMKAFNTARDSLLL